MVNPTPRDPTAPHPRRYAFALVAGVLVVAFVELLAAGILLAVPPPEPPDRSYETWDAWLAHRIDRRIARFRPHYDPRLGWRLAPDDDDGSRKWSYSLDRDGARTSAYTAQPRPLLAYGDSFTFGTQVEDGGTWPELLSRMLGERVVNFGVPGYGPDQAVLLLERHLQLGRSPRAVVLGINDSNVRRLMNAYRPFLDPRTPLSLGFKPMFSATDGGHRLLPNPLPSLEDGADGVQRALALARERDWYYNHPLGEISFPFSLGAFRALYHRLAVDRDLDPGQPSWRHPPSLATLSFVVDRLVAQAAASDFRPVVLFIPSGHNVRRREEGLETTYAAFVRSLRSRHGARVLTVVDALEGAVAGERFHVNPYRGHASAYGNRLIARRVRAALRDDLAAPAESGRGAGAEVE